MCVFTSVNSVYRMESRLEGQVLGTPNTPCKKHLWERGIILVPPSCVHSRLSASWRKTQENKQKIQHFDVCTEWNHKIWVTCESEEADFDHDKPQSDFKRTKINVKHKSKTVCCTFFTSRKSGGVSAGMVVSAASERPSLQVSLSGRSQGVNIHYREWKEKRGRGGRLRREEKRIPGNINGIPGPALRHVCVCVCVCVWVEGGLPPSRRAGLSKHTWSRMWTELQWTVFLISSHRSPYLVFAALDATPPDVLLCCRNNNSVH